MEHPFIIIDGNSLMYRAFFALQTPMSSRDGTPTGALHGRWLSTYTGLRSVTSNTTNIRRAVGRRRMSSGPRCLF